MGKQRVIFSSAKKDWRTPKKLFEELSKEFDFTLDVAASVENAKCKRFFTEKENALLQSWNTEGDVFCNPPYGRELGKWVEKARNESERHNINVVVLIPARTDTKYFHEHILGHAELRFIRGRLKFEIDDGVAAGTAPFPSVIVVYKRRNNEETNA